MSALWALRGLRTPELNRPNVGSDRALDRALNKRAMPRHRAVGAEHGNEASLNCARNGGFRKYGYLRLHTSLVRHRGCGPEAPARTGSVAPGLDPPSKTTTSCPGVRLVVLRLNAHADDPERGPLVFHDRMLAFGSYAANLPGMRSAARHQNRVVMPTSQLGMEATNAASIILSRPRSTNRPNTSMITPNRGFATRPIRMNRSRRDRSDRLDP